MNLNRAVDVTTINGVNEIKEKQNEYDVVVTKRYYLIVKRLCDLILSFIGLVLLSPVFLVIVILIKIDSKGPAFFVQNRIGKNGKLFKLYKFRSMVLNADEILFKMLREDEVMRDEYRINKKLKDDPRMTRVGLFLRKISLDELPQLLNIFLGDMSFIGPRPYLERELIDIDGYYDYIVACKPGLSGLWQVSGRSNVTFESRLKIDKEYYYIKSLKMDTKIFFDTIKFVVKKEGAM
ncbi:MAG: sugar transferase [Oscillospiraceae bacterium]|nr:sugar transferase [Oscillospiraceae bacterium]